MKTAAIGIDNKRVENDPDLVLCKDDMIAVHKWLAMASKDVTLQLSTMKPPAIMSDKGRKQVETTIIGTRFLKNWIEANLQQIEGALVAAGVTPDVVLDDSDLRPAEDERIN